MRLFLAAVAALSLSACATHAAPEGPPSLAEPQGETANATSRLYAACLDQAAETGTYDRMGGLIRFHCGGAPAEAFYAALAPFAGQSGFEYHDGDRTIRTTQKLQRDLVGLDYCWEKGGVHGCTLVFNAGPFLLK